MIIQRLFVFWFFAGVLLSCVANAQGTDPFAEDTKVEEKKPFAPSGAPTGKQRPAVPSTNETEGVKKAVKSEKAVRRKIEIEGLRRKANADAERLFNDEEKIKKLLFRLAAHAPADLHREVADNFKQMFQHQATLQQLTHAHESRVLELGTEVEESEEWFREKLNDTEQEIENLRSVADEVQHELHLANQSLADIQTWFAHAVQSVEQPDVQRWVLARLKNHGEVLRSLVDAAHRDVDLTATGKECRLESELKQAAALQLSPTSIAASEVLHLIERDSRGDYVPSPQSTLPWPIVTEIGREAEQDLLNRINGLNEFEAVEIDFNDFFEFCEALTDISIQIDASATKLITEKGELYINLDKKRRSFRSVLEQTLPAHGLTYQIRDESCVITTVENAKVNPIRRVYQVWEQAEPESLAEALTAAMEDANLKIIRSSNALIAVGDEQAHYELAKLLTLMFQARWQSDGAFE